MRKMALAGGAEFGGTMDLLDRRSIASAGGPGIGVSIIPAAAAPDKNHERAGQNGTNWFRKLGIADVRALPLTDRSSADNPQVAAALRQSDLIYLLGGFPGHLAATLAGSRAWEAIEAAMSAGAVISGSSAGAMVLCEHFFDPHLEGISAGLNLIAGACILPHHNTFGKSWAPRLRQLLPEAILIGIDERTGLLSDESGESWQVFGAGAVVVYGPDRIDRYSNEDTVSLNLSNLNTSS